MRGLRGNIGELDLPTYLPYTAVLLYQQMSKDTFAGTISISFVSGSF